MESATDTLGRLKRVSPVLALIAVAAVGWAITAGRMAGMDAGPGGDLGATGWFMGTWALMMVAMMLPVVAPVAVRYVEQREQRTPAEPAVQTTAFVGAYVAVWAAAGLVAYEAVAAGRHVLGGTFAWDHGGRWAAVAALALAGAYQLTSRKRISLERCRRASGSTGASAGLRAGVTCLGSSWAMMASLFALGVMSLWWMGVVAVLIAGERLPPKAAPGRLAAAAVFIVLALGIAISPSSVPGLTVPGSPAAMKAMMRMSPSPAMKPGAGGMGMRRRPAMK